MNDRSPKMEVALGAAYEQMQKPKDAIASKVSKSLTRSVVVLDQAWEHSLSPR